MIRARLFFWFINLITVSAFSFNSVAQGFGWAQGFIPSGTSNGTAGIGRIAFDANNNIYTVGGVAGTLDVDQSSNVYNVSSVGNAALFVLKQDASGNFQWVKEFQCKSASNFGFIGTVGIAIDFAGYIYLSGAFYDTVDFDPGPGEYYLSAVSLHPNIAVVKLSPSGDFVWAKQIGGNTNTSALGWRDMKIDKRGVYIIGAFGGTIDVDPGPATINMSPIGTPNAMLIERLDTAGNYLWAKQINGGSALGLYVDTFSNLYLTGAFNNTVDFDPDAPIAHLVSNGNSDIFIAKLDSLANYQWARAVGGPGSDMAQGIAVDNFGNVIVTGYYAGGTVDFDPGLGVYNITGSSRDMFTLRLRGNGDFAWAKSVSPMGNDDGRAVTTDTQGNVYTTGEFFSPADFDPGPGVYELQGGVYVQKLDSAGNFVWARSWDADIPGWIGMDYSGDIYVTGSFNGVVDFDPGPGVFTLNGSNAGFIQKLCGSSLPLTAVEDTICLGATTHSPGE